MEKIYRLGTSRNSKSKQKSQKFGQIVNEWGRNRSDRQKWETRSLRSVFLVKSEKAAVAACATHSHTAPLPRINPPAPHLNPHHQLFHSPRETADTVEKFIDDNTRQNCILVQCVPHWKISPKKRKTNCAGSLRQQKPQSLSLWPKIQEPAIHRCQNHAHSQITVRNSFPLAVSVSESARLNPNPQHLELEEQQIQAKYDGFPCQILKVSLKYPQKCTEVMYPNVIFKVSD